MKHGNEFFLQLSREIFTETYSHLSNNAKWLFVVLNELEHRYTGDNKKFFYRCNKDLCKDCNMSLATFKRAKSELISTNLVSIEQKHFWYDTTKTKSEYHISVYRILK